MTLKPRFPVFEISMLLVLLFSALRFLSVRTAVTAMAVGFVLLISFTILGYLVNKNFIQARLEETLTVRGFFGGEKMIAFDSIYGYKLQKIKIPKRFGHDFSLSIVGNRNETIFEIIRGDYNPNSFDDFVNALQDRRIQRLD